MIFEYASNRVTLNYSSVPGTRKTIVVCGKPLVWCGFYPPTMRNTPGGIGIFSIGENLKMMLAFDKANMENPRELMDLLEDNAD